MLIMVLFQSIAGLGNDPRASESSFITSEELQIICKMKAYSCGDLQGTCLHLKETLSLDDDKRLLSNLFF